MYLIICWAERINDEDASWAKAVQTQEFGRKKKQQKPNLFDFVLVLV